MNQTVSGDLEDYIRVSCNNTSQFIILNTVQIINICKIFPGKPDVKNDKGANFNLKSRNRFYSMITK